MGNVDSNFWHNKKVFLTGHTGFKGGWLSIWLHSLGAKIYGYALPPNTNPSLFYEANLEKYVISTIGDICDYKSLSKALDQSSPDIVIHMAAQPLVRRSYTHPLETYATNVMGVVNLLEAIRKNGNIKTVLNVTTDKCYENKEWLWAYREDERIGGSDPYSNSKACAELVTSAYRQSFFQSSDIAIATARAGNVIGGGDWASDRLVPDILRSLDKKSSISVRYPQSIRPWQHVLEPLSGYLSLAQKLYEQGQEYAESWNFGPNENDARSVIWVVEKLLNCWGDKNISWEYDLCNNPHESSYLKLDSSKAKFKLGWKPRWNLAQALDEIIYWHRAWLDKKNVMQLCLQQISSFNQAAINDI